MHHGRHYLNLLLLLAAQIVQAQTYTPGNTYFGSDGYIEYLAGNTAIILSVPHGGRLTPASLPDRDCEDCVYGIDGYTQDVAREFYNAFVERTGCYPHVVINLLHRKKLDMNRDSITATDSSDAPGVYWHEYHGFADAAKTRITQDFGKGLFLDLHGHGHVKQRIELGYMLTSARLQQSDSAINTLPFIALSGFRNLANNNLQSIDHAMLLRGSQSLGTMLTDAGFAAVPSSKDPYPLPEDDYFNGGYNTLRHGSRNGGSIDAVQMELYSSIRNVETERKAFVDSLVRIVLRFMTAHYFQQYENTPCSFANSIAHAVPAERLALYPNPVGDRLYIASSEDIEEVRIFNILGMLVLERQGQGISALPTGILQPGMYLISLRTRTGEMLHGRFLRK